MRNNIEVLVHFKLDGSMMPFKFRFTKDNEIFTYTIDKVGKPEKSASLTLGVHGLKYPCRIQNKNVNLYFDEFSNKWYVEKA